MENSDEKEFVDRIRQLIISVSLNDYGDDYWIAVTKGLQLLYEYKEKIEMEKLKSLYEETRLKLAGLPLGDIVHDLSDELTAILIRWYPMPDFWTEDIDAFKKYRGFSEYFEMIK